jgi:filamentous hemagglutinin family protein
MKRRPAHISFSRLAFHVALTCGLGVGVCATTVLAAGPPGVKLDGTLGGSAALLTGPTYNITQNLGRLAGGNLFFSFQYFNIATNETALFTTTSAGINNVISRVTGGYASIIDGEIELSAASGAPNFYFINPSGVTFTANASVNVPAAFAVTTANYLKFSDGNFYSDPTKTSTLSEMAPEAFGFLGTTRAPVNIEGAQLYAGGGNGEFQVVAGDVTIDGGGQLAAIETASGDVRVIATGAQAVEVPLTGTFISTDGTVTLQAGGQLIREPFPTVAAGGIYVSAGTLQIDGTNDVSYESGIYSDGGTVAGPIRVDVTGTALINNGGTILSSTATNGAGASITLNAGALTIQGENSFGSSVVESVASGNGAGGAITMNVAGPTNILNGGVIASSTATHGAGASITLNTGTLTIQGQNSNGVSQVFSIASGPGVGGTINLNVTGPVNVVDGSVVASTIGSRVDCDVACVGRRGRTGGNICIIAHRDRSRHVESDSAGNAPGGIAGAIGNNSPTGHAGAVILKAGSLDIDGGRSSRLTGITSSSQASGNAGQVFVDTTGAAKISHNGEIESATFASGAAGDVTVMAGSLDVDAAGTSTAIVTGIGSSAETGSSGNAGKVSVTTSGATTIKNGGDIQSATSASGNAGDVTLTAGSLNIDGLNSAISTSAYSGSSGNAGQLSVTTTGAVTVSNDGTIDSNTFGSGNAGKVAVTTTGPITISNAGILSVTAGAGNAGDVTITAGSLSVENGSSNNYSAITTNAAQGSTGSAGNVTVDVSGTATLTDYGAISSASHGAAGQPGTVAISAGTLVVGDNGLISVKNYSTVADPTRITPTQIDIHAGTIQMDGGQITAASTGNIAASAVDIDYQQTLHLDPSNITTTSNQGNGDPITITGQGLLWLQNSSITTSVLGTTNGNGGDIRITVPYIVLDSGVIQANTTAPKASGGDVVISAQALIPSFEYDVLGGNIVSFDSAISGENVVQAAAPDGVSGTLDLTKPTLNLGSALLGLTGTPSTPIALSRSLCTYRRGSSLAVAGRGGLPVSYRNPLWIDFSEAKSGAAAGAPAAARAAAVADRSESHPPYQWLPLIACR